MEILVRDDCLVIVVAAVIEAYGLVLACRRAPHKSLAGKWEFPGGKVEASESDVIALKREVAEELGIDILVGEFLIETNLGEIEMRSYSASLVGDAPKASTDHDQLRWVTPQELSDLDWAELDIPVVELLVSRAQ